MPRGTHRERTGELSLARSGAGPLLQRDYWAVLDACGIRPSQVMARVAAWFERFAPRELAAFERREPGLRVGDELAVRIAWAGLTRVRVLHRDEQSLTLATCAGHPEAGRITFGAYRNARGDVVFHIRSRARAGSRAKYLAFLGLGEAMQTNTWTDFVNRVAAATCRGVRGAVHAETRTIADADDAEPSSSPTFAARGD